MSPKRNMDIRRLKKEAENGLFLARKMAAHFQRVTPCWEKRKNMCLEF